jgi:hypothetical protein
MTSNMSFSGTLRDREGRSQERRFLAWRRAVQSTPTGYEFEKSGDSVCSVT